MRRFFSLVPLAIMAIGVATMPTAGQESSRTENQRDSSRSDNNRSDNSSDDNRSDDQSDSYRQSSSTSRSARQDSSDAEARITYDDDGNRLRIQVDDEYRFRDNQNDEAWARDGEFGLRYDRDANQLTGRGEGTLRLDEIGSDIGRWWQSWWEDERQARRSRQQGAEWGAYEFIRRHDRNSDGFLTRNELPQSDRSEFGQIDVNRDNYLSRSEVHRYGDSLYDRSSRGNVSYTNRDSQDDQTWSEWWASWWSDDQQSQDRNRGSDTGARQFVRQHDDNNDGYVSRQEIPSRMRDEFADVDTNNDGYLAVSEIRQGGSQLYRSDRSQTTSPSRDRSQTASSSQHRRDDDSQDQTWSEWWASWWSDNDTGNAEDVARQGAGEFLRRHDDNNDNVLVRSEMPSGMYDEFTRIDRNDDRRLSRSEIQQYASNSRSRYQDDRRTTSRSTGYDRTSDRTGRWTEHDGARQSPGHFAYVVIVDPANDAVKLRDLQQSYGLLRKLDADGNGQISSSEFQNRREDALVQWCQQSFEMLDENSDDALSHREASGSMFATQFDDYDQNGDDRLTMDEVRQTVGDHLQSQTSASRSDSNDRR